MVQQSCCRLKGSSSKIATLGSHLLPPRHKPSWEQKWAAALCTFPFQASRFHPGNLRMWKADFGINAGIEKFSDRNFYKWKLPCNGKVLTYLLTPRPAFKMCWWLCICFMLFRPLIEKLSIIPPLIEKSPRADLLKIGAIFRKDSYPELHQFNSPPISSFLFAFFETIMSLQAPIGAPNCIYDALVWTQGNNSFFKSLQYDECNLGKLTQCT